MYLCASSDILCALFLIRLSIFRRHPGCICKKGFIGDKCQFTINKSDYKNTNEGFFFTDDGKSLSGFGIFAIILLLLVVGAVGWFFVKNCLRRRRFNRKNSGESSGLIWAQKGGFKDDAAETVNFSPHKGGYSEDYMASFASPSRDPMATALAPDTMDSVYSDSSAAPLSPSSNSHSSFQITDDEPQIFIGPPTDEDGHELHNVDIL